MSVPTTFVTEYATGGGARADHHDSDSDSVSDTHSGLGDHPGSIIDDHDSDHDSDYDAALSASVVPTPVLPADTPKHGKLGAKHAHVYTSDGVGDPRVAMNGLIVRGADVTELRRLMDETYKLRDTDPNALFDLFLLPMQIRNIRGGRGERLIAYHLYAWLLQKFTRSGSEVPYSVVYNYIKLIPHYGSWADLFSLYDLIESTYPDVLSSYTDIMMQIVNKQLVDDVNELARNPAKPKLSLLGKWLPREGNKKTTEKRTLPRKLAVYCFPNANKRRSYATYRKTIASLNEALKTVEVMMSSTEHRWDEIEMEKVPARAMMHYKVAFANQRKTKRKGMVTRSTDPDRLECERTYKAYLAALSSGQKKAKGANTLFPHEIVMQFKKLHDDHPDVALMNATWESVVSSPQLCNLEGLRDCVVVSDVSGSMETPRGLPMAVSIAMGMLVSEATTGAFHNKVITFHDNPTMVDLSTCPTPYARYTKLAHAPWGGSTNVIATMRMIANTLRDNPDTPIPKRLIIVTDMGFDAISPQMKSWTTHVDAIREIFRTALAGRFTDTEMPSIESLIPTIVIWNVAASYNDHHAHSVMQGVTTLSGWSPNILRSLTGQVVRPIESLRSMLDDRLYNPVRQCLDILLDDSDSDDDPAEPAEEPLVPSAAVTTDAITNTMDEA